MAKTQVTFNRRLHGGVRNKLSSRANSTIKIAFFGRQPTSTIDQPDLREMLLSPPVSCWHGGQQAWARSG
jgi:hypothetical protein